MRSAADSSSGALLAMTLSIVVSLAIASLVQRRVRRLATAAGTIAGGNFDHPVNDHFPDDIGRLAASIDEMRERLAVAFAVVERERGSLSAVLNRLEEGVIALDATGLVQIVNPAASELLGAAIEPGACLQSPWPAALLDPYGAEVETPRGRWLRVQRVALRPGEEHGPSLLVVSDRTAERNREASERRFLANASHELRTPLAAIVAAVEVLEAGAKDDVTARDTFLADLQHEAHRLQRLTDRLLTVARMGSQTLQPSLQPVELAARLAYISELMQPLAETGGVAIATEGDALALADPDILDQVLVGLVGNALKHTPRGGTIRLVASNDGVRPSIAVIDTGEGIAESELPHVFDRFWRSDDARPAGGFGLGLGICREHVEAMNGMITIDSELGKRNGGRGVAHTSTRRRGKTGGSDLMADRILVADDEETLVRAVTYALEREGYEVDSVFNGTDALSRARTGTHDLAILDVMMPGASGLAVCREIRAESALPIILLTARDAEADTVVGLEAGADDYVTKPFSVAELMSRVAALLTAPTPRRERPSTATPLGRRPRN